MRYTTTAMSVLPPLLNKRQEEVTLFVEAACTLVYQLKSATCKTDVVVSLGACYRSLTGQSVIGKSLELVYTLGAILEESVTSLQGPSDWIDVCDGLYNNLHRVRGSVLGQKLIRVFNHLFAHIAYHKMGLEFDSELFNKLEEKKIRPTVWNALSFADAIVNLLLFLAKQARHALATGDIDCFFVDGGVASDFIMKVNKLRKDFEFLGNPDCVGIKIPLFLKEVEEAITVGEGMRRVLTDANQKRFLELSLLELSTLQRRYKSTSAASSQRFAPVSIFLYGDAGIGKSFLMNGMFMYYCKLRGLREDQQVMYSRCFDDKYWSGYKSWMAGICLDDVAKHKLTRVQGPDPTLSEVISLLNNIAFITNQAEVSDKGKVPVLSEWVGITSNVADLNVQHNYNNTNAVLRRIPVRITPIVKDAFVVPGTTRLDPSKVPAGNYPDCWRFSIAEVHQLDAVNAVYKETHMFDNYAQLLEWLHVYYTSHITKQTNYMQSIAKMNTVALCKCNMPVELCVCEDELQSNPLSSIAISQYTYAKYGNLPALERQFCREFFEDNLPQGSTMEQLELVWCKCLEHLEVFRGTPVFDQIDMLRTVPSLGKPRPWLNFTPTTGAARLFTFASIKKTYDWLREYQPLGNEEVTDACLGDFVTEIAPCLYSAGWDDRSIVKASLSYVDYFKTKIDIVARNSVKKMFDLTQERGWRDAIIKQAVCWYLDKWWVRQPVNFVLGSKKARSVIRWIFSESPTLTQQLVVQGARLHDEKLLGGHWFVQIVRLAGFAAIVTGVMWTMRKIFSQQDSRISSEGTKLQVKIVEPAQPFVETPVVVQEVAALREIGRMPVVRGDDKVNPWVCAERDVTSASFLPGRCTNLSQLEKKLINNLVCVTIHGVSEEGHFTVPTRALVLDCNTVLINAHSLKDAQKMTIHFGSTNLAGVRPDVEITLSPGMLRTDRKRDLTWITTLGLPAIFKNITTSFVKKGTNLSFDGYYLIKQTNGEIKKLKAVAPRWARHIMDSSGIDVVGIHTRPEQPTQAGDCGSILVMETKWGPAIVGIHYAWSPQQRLASATPFWFEDHTSTSSVQCGELDLGFDLVQDTKLFTDFHETGKMMVHGGNPGFRPRMKANGVKSEIASFIFEHSLEYGIKSEDNLHRPVMTGWEPPQIALKEYLTPTHSIDEDCLNEVVNDMIEYFSANLTVEDWEDIHPVNVDVAVCGYPGVPNVDAQKVRTSGGFGYPGPKKLYMESLGKVGAWQDYRRYKHEVEEKINEYWELYKKGIRCHPIASAQLKDEFVSYKKLKAKKTRVFFMCQLWFLTLLRTQTLGLTRVMIRRRLLFGNAVGLNTHSDEWHALFEHMNEPEGENWVAGDFKGFDKILSITILNAVKKILLALAERSGNYRPEELLAFEAMLADVVHPTVDFFGTVITLLGGEISGHQLTTIYNSTANVILHYYAFKKTSSGNFWDLVRICTLGDDVFIKVDNACPTYNHTTIQEVFGNMGIEYTMADKDSESRPYIALEEVTFLKRMFADHEEFPVKVAPLDKASLIKMLCYSIPSNTESPGAQLAQACGSAVSEAFYHGRDFFESFNRMLADAPKSLSFSEALIQYPLPTWDQLRQRFVESSPSLGLSTGLSQKCTPSVSYCLNDSSLIQSERSVELTEHLTMGRSPEVAIQRGDRLDSRSSDKVSCAMPRFRLENQWHTKNFMKVENDYYNVPCTPVRKLDTNTAKKVCTLAQFRAKQRRRWKVDAWGSTELQSEKVYAGSDTTGNSDVHYQQMTFANEPQGAVEINQAKANPVAKESKLPQELGEYLSRPLKIFDYQWAENGADGLKTTYRPWGLYFSNLNIQKKLFGFSLLRANMRIKVLINGSPFYYGSMWHCYTPLVARTDTAYSAISNITLVASSQKPGVWLNPQSLSTAEMTLPFLWPYPYIDIQSQQTMNDLGKVELFQYAPLLSANGTNAQNLDIAVYAWLEDVELSGPSDQAILQSERVPAPVQASADAKEYRDSPQISEIASGVAEVAGALSWVPGIGPYAMATAEMATAAGEVASAFGYTNVPNVSDVGPVKIMPFQMASSSISEPVNKLSLQPKQETCLGSSQFGGREEDELAISNFVQRESYMTAIDWPVSGATAPIGSSLFTWAVSPLSFTRYTAASPNEVAHTPMSYLSQMFQWWRGDIIVRVKVIKSKYHRGRLALSWDRAANDLSEGAVLGNPNSLTVIADLDETDEVEMRIPYMQQQQFLETYAALTIPGSDPYSTSATPTGSWSKVNGVFNIRVMNRLSAPEPTSTVRLQIFVRGAENLDFAGPLDWSTITSSDITGPSRNLSSILQSEKTYDLGVGSTDAGEVYQEVFGEKIVSLRELLHRSSLAISVPFTTQGASSASLSRLEIPLKRLPPPTGCYNNGWSSATVNSVASQRVNFSKFHPLWVIAMCFVGFKGSTNVTVNVDGTERVYPTLSIGRTQQGSSLSATNRRPRVKTYPATDSESLKSRNYSLLDSGATGFAITNTRTNTGMVANLPFYSASGFHVVDPDGYYNNQDDVTTANSDWWLVTAHCTTSSTSDLDNTVANLYYCSGPDFNTVFFINVPVLSRCPVTLP